MYSKTFAKILYTDITKFFVLYAVVMVAFTGSVILALKATKDTSPKTMLVEISVVVTSLFLSFEPPFLKPFVFVFYVAQLCIFIFSFTGWAVFLKEIRALTEGQGFNDSYIDSFRYVVACSVFIHKSVDFFKQQSVHATKMLTTAISHF